MTFLKPKVVISKCLTFSECRYDGQIIHNQYIENLKKFVEFQTVCPEVEIGMGTPRNPIRIIEDNESLKLKQSETNLDWAKKMNSFSNKYISKISKIDGFILKAASPSCGINSAKIFSPKSPAPIRKGAGFFASKIIKQFPDHPKEEEKRLNNPFLREHFFTSIFTIADFRFVKDMNTLYKYHAKHKYLFMAYNQTLMRKMGKVAANENNDSFQNVLNNYYKLILLTLSKRARYTSNINTHMHVMGYFKNQISNQEKQHFLDLIEQYRIQKIHLSAINNLLASWILRFDNSYLKKQSFFNPFPIELIEKEVSRFE